MAALNFASFDQSLIEATVDKDDMQTCDRTFIQASLRERGGRRRRREEEEEERLCACVVSSSTETMERCLQLSPSPSFCTRKSGLTSSCRATLMARGSLSSEHLPFFWQPHLRLDADDLLAEAPSLRRNCEDLDWKSQASHLRALASRSVPHQSLGAFSNESLIQEKDQTNNVNKADGSNETWFTAGVALIAAALFHCGLILSAVAEEASDKTEAAEAASRVPGWLTPTLLAFPVVSYAIFNVYRSQVNPYAKVSDWMFGVVAVVIVANIVLMFTIGVRLY